MTKPQASAWGVCVDSKASERRFVDAFFRSPLFGGKEGGVEGALPLEEEKGAD